MWKSLSDALSPRSTNSLDFMRTRVHCNDNVVAAAVLLQTNAFYSINGGIHSIDWPNTFSLCNALKMCDKFINKPQSSFSLSLLPMGTSQLHIDTNNFSSNGICNLMHAIANSGKMCYDMLCTDRKYNAPRQAHTSFHATAAAAAAAIASVAIVNKNIECFVFNLCGEKMVFIADCIISALVSFELLQHSPPPLPLAHFNFYFFCSVSFCYCSCCPISVVSRLLFFCILSPPSFSFVVTFCNEKHFVLFFLSFVFSFLPFFLSLSFLSLHFSGWHGKVQTIATKWNSM